MNDRSPHDIVTPEAAGQDITLTACLSFAVGAWLVVSPAVLGYAGHDPWWNPIGVGMLLALFTLAHAAGAVRSTVAPVLTALAGVWLLGSAAWLATDLTAACNLAGCGAAVLVLAGVGARTRPSPARRGPATGDRVARRARPAA